MIRQVFATAFVVVVSLTLAPPLHAQNPNSQKPKRNANQVPETGQDDPGAAPDARFDRSPETLTFVTLPNGTVMAQLDESFMEASTVTIGADGALTFEHFTGLKRAENTVRGLSADGLLRARPLPLLYLINKDKE
jgi:hypothetical protein